MDDYNTKPMSISGRQIFDAFHDALELHTPGPQVPIDLVKDLELSIQLNLIALALARCAWLQAGKSLSDMKWNEFSPALQDRYRKLAEKAICAIDPAVGLHEQAKAAKETGDWMDEPYNPDTKPSYEDIAHYAISTYEFRMASLRVKDLKS